MNARPVLGISACTRAFAGETAQVVIDRYMVAAMRHADAAALLIPARPDLMSAAEVATRLDGLLLTGSPSNVAPGRYGAAHGNGPFDEGRDSMSLALIEAMIARGKPIFGICRGFQEINVAFGGSLDTSLGDAERALPHHAPRGASLEATYGHHHPVNLTAGGVLARTLGATHLMVNSVHYQGVARLGEGLAVEATAPDGVIEAFSGKPEGAQLLAVQWHPEWQSDRNPASLGFFRLLGQALRGQPIFSEERDADAAFSSS